MQHNLLGIIWSLLGVVGMGWMSLMWRSPTHISLIEVFLFWLLYVMLGVVSSAYSINIWKGGSSFYNGDYEDELLDN